MGRNFTSRSDEDLMHQVCKGEVAAFDELYSRYGKRLLSYFTRMLNFDKCLAEDALQDLFLKLAEAPERFDRTRSFRTWIFSVASNTCKNYYRHVKVKNAYALHCAHFAEELITEDFSGAGRIDSLRFRDMLNEALQELSPEKRETFILRYQEEKTIAEIADIQQCPEGSVKSRLHYVIKGLEEKLRIYKPTEP